MNCPFWAFVLTVWIPFSMPMLPEDQPGCLFRPDMSLFFNYNYHLRPNAKNWLCKETFEERLKICIDLYQKTSQGKVETSYEIVKDKESVERECRRRNMTFTQIFASDESAYVANDTIRNVTFEVNMFACPITKMDLKFPVSWLEPELFDIYISLGRNDVTVAALRDSVHLDNICVRDVYLYPPKDLRSTPRTRPFWPEEIRDYRYMDDAYFSRLSSKVHALEMAATASGEISQADILTTLATSTQSTAVIPGTAGDKTLTSPEEVSETVSHTKATRKISLKKPSKKTKPKKKVTKKTLKAKKTSKTTALTPER